MFVLRATTCSVFGFAIYSPVTTENNGKTGSENEHYGAAIPTPLVTRSALSHDVHLSSCHPTKSTPRLLTILAPQT